MISIFPSRFVGVRVGQEPALEEVMIDGLPLWPLIYYSLRSGDIASAVQYVKLAG